MSEPINNYIIVSENTAIANGVAKSVSLYIKGFNKNTKYFLSQGYLNISILEPQD